MVSGKGLNSIYGYWETSMDIRLTDEAKELLDLHFSENTLPECIRVYVRPRNDKRGRSLALKPDARSERDLGLEKRGYTFAVSRHLAEQIGSWVEIDASVKGGFMVTAEKCFNSYCQIRDEV
jgi:hypothetical protein